MGTPRGLLTEKDDLAWAKRLSTWGKESCYRLAADDDRPACNLRFAGQYADEESGLHYNRHRYYDSETGQYLNPDPIGLAGGLNPYGYVHNPLGWGDPLGWLAVRLNLIQGVRRLGRLKGMREYLWGNSRQRLKWLI